MKSLPKHVKQAIQCGPIPKIRDWRSLEIAKLTRAERAMRFIEAYLMVPEGALIGQKVHLDVFQEAFFYAVFDNKHTTRRAFLSIARKNAKTATIACLLLVFVCGPEAQLNSRLVSGAMSRDQAAEVFNYASKMIQLSPDLTKRTRVIPSSKCIIGLSKNVEYRAVSAEGRTAHGKSPLIAILD
uniref:terminase large subunit domain-containing protein n=1 Tax=uncultured Limnobacter sp. TaxID=199681 RepID=UPI0030F4C038